VEKIDVRDLDLEVNPSSIRVLQWRSSKPPSGAIRLLEHQVDGAAG
jgi:hypothetical protein